MAKSEKRKDMENLAKLTYELSKKYGDIYINCACCKNSNLAWVTYGAKYDSASYWGDKGKFTTG